ncbi:MAG: dihydrolipoamide dehydrogenase [Alphaproteobacteria bacterium]|nr:dihydrolipoamide dehydrogenase [Alphaproteobacteria bacterium]
MDEISCDLCIIGAGSGGLSVAAGAAQMGARVVLVEKGRMGGDCLNTGCVPSKALIKAARIAESVRHAARFGVNGHEPAIDLEALRGHVAGAIASIAPHDSVERFEGLGCTVIKAEARFLGPDRIEAGGRVVRAKRFVVATGSRPAVPKIPGLADLPFLTNESVFDLRSLPRHLLVVGGGPIGIELAQAFRHLGSEVTVIEAATILAKDDPELVEVVRGRLLADGIDLREGAKVLAATRAGNGVALTLAGAAGETRIEGSDLLVAAGRTPDLGQLGLEAAGVDWTQKGVQVDARLRTSNRRVFAVGDAVGDRQFTHWAGYHAGVVLKNALFRLPAKVDVGLCPWVTYTAPELAQVGLAEAEARKVHGEVQVLRARFADNDRARTEADAGGLVKAVVTKRGRILGCGIVGAEAGELIQVWELAIRKRLRIGALAEMVAPYPTRGEASKRAAGSFYTPAIFGARTKRIVRFLMRFA